MKLFVAVLVAFAVVGCNASPTKFSLESDLKDLRKLIPEAKIKALALDYLANDPEFPELLVYLKGDDFQQLWSEVLALDHIKEIINYCEKHNVNAIEILNLIAGILGLPSFTPGLYMETNLRTGGIAGYFKDVEALVPHDDIKRMVVDKYQNSAEFRGLADLLELNRLEQFLKTSASGKKFVAFMKDHKVDTQHYMDLLKELFDAVEQQ